MRTLYTQKNEANIDAVIAAFEQLNFEEMLDFAFNYSWSSSFKFYKNFLMQKLVV